ncbi:DUF1850 domain-containing protein [Marinospirillum insulare]|uniref:DUF1850 domain-containing protein n=1 Tax=Marinospirillum insulare TaxID=217169 RepID=UPI0005643F3A|nr:DUF1850 domain-containing protein [Marinospirillum insulare]
MLLLTPLALASPAYSLQVINQDEQLILNLPLNEQEGWCLVWNHSVAGFAVEDCFIVKAGQWILDSSHQPDFAAGLGHTLGRGKMLSDGQGGYHIQNMAVKISGNQMLLRVGSLAVNHRFDYRKKTISLSELAAGQRVTLKILRN